MNMHFAAAAADSVHPATKEAPLPAAIVSKRLHGVVLHATGSARFVGVWVRGLGPTGIYKRSVGASFILQRFTKID